MIQDETRVSLELGSPLGEGLELGLIILLLVISNWAKGVLVYIGL